ncbi:MAG: BRO family protein [Ruthenibacterium sp.]
MSDKKAIKLFGDKEIRTVWDADLEEWYFSIVDTVAVLTEQQTSKAASTYWAVLKKRMTAEGSQLLTNCKQLKLKASDGKNYATDVATAAQLLRIVQSIPSPKAEPFKMWLAQVGSDRLDETADPELSIQRALYTYKKKGYSEKWINQRLKSIEFRKDLTDEWDRVGIKNSEYAVLTNEITKAWADMTTGEYKAHKGLKKESLRDNMTNTELVLNMLAELSTTEISKTVDPKTLSESKQVAKQGGTVAKNARLELEQKTGRKAITKTTAKNKSELDK